MKKINKEGFTLSCKSFRSRLLRTLHSRSHRKTFANQVSQATLAHSYGFTLAEVLITISILGVVAVILIPNMVHKIQDRQQITAVKKTWAMLENALQEMYIVEGRPSTWNWTAYTTKEQQSNFFSQKLAKYLSVSKFCGSATGCFPEPKDSKCSYRTQAKYCSLHHVNRTDGPYYMDHVTYGKMKLKNGMSLSTHITPTMFASDIVTDGTNKIRVDINGNNGPNRLGYDVFYFEFNDKGLLFANANYYSFLYCNKTPPRINTLDAHTCSTWIIKHNNMDYKYRDISAEW